MTIFLTFFIPFAFFVGRGFVRARRARRDAAEDVVRKAEYAAWLLEQRSLRRNKMFTDVGLDWQKTDRELDVPNDLFLPTPQPTKKKLTSRQK